MPKVNPTLLDRLIKEGKIVSHSDFPESMSRFGRLQSNPDELANPLVVGERMYAPRKLTPERKVYQRGIEARLYPKKVAADELLDEANTNRDMIEDEWRDAIDDAKESMREDWESGLDYQSFEDVDPYYLEVDAPNTDLGEYWPSSARSPEEIGEAFDEATDAYYDAKDAQKRIYSTRGIMDEQLLTPRYRNYQRAMQQRAANKRYGHMIAREEAKRRQLDAYIRDMLRSGMTMEDIRRELGAVRDAVPGSQNYNDLRQSYGPNWNGLKRTLRGGR